MMKSEKKIVERICSRNFSCNSQQSKCEMVNGLRIKQKKYGANKKFIHEDYFFFLDLTGLPYFLNPFTTISSMEDCTSVEVNIVSALTRHTRFLLLSFKSIIKLPILKSRIDERGCATMPGVPPNGPTFSISERDDEPMT